MDASFPSKPYETAGSFFDDYMQRLERAAAAVNRDDLQRVASTLGTVFAAGGTLFVCGNGGSAAVSNHLTCDMLKGVRTDTATTSRVVSLATQVELITAIANDMSFEEIFVYQLRSLAKPGDALMTISASGNSENIVRAVSWARENGIKTIAMTGFSGGRSQELCDLNLHVPERNYGVVEDVHQSLMHTLAQFLRLSGMPIDLVRERAF